MKKPYPVTWWSDATGASLDSRIPWWCLSSRLVKLTNTISYQQYLMTAAVMAESSEDAKAEIMRETVSEEDLDWHSVIEHHHGWSPFNTERPQDPDVIWDHKAH